MFKKSAERDFVPLLTSVKYKTLTYGEKTSLSEFIFKKGALEPDHKHPLEQTGYVVSGRIIMTVGGESFEALAGDSWNIPSNVDHSAEVLEDTVIVEVFSPAREDYLP